MNKTLLNKVEILSKILLVFSCFFCIVFNTTFFSAKVVSCFVLFLSIRMLVHSRHNDYLVIVYGFITYANYSICAAYYLFPVNNFFTTFKKDEKSVLAISVLYVFMAIINIADVKNSKNEDKSDFENICIRDKSKEVTWIGCILLIIGVFVKSGAIFEYSLIIFIICYYYSENRLQEIFLALLAFCYIYKNLSGESRVVSLQLIIVMYLFNKRLRKHRMFMLLFVVVLVVLFSFIGYSRVNNDFFGLSLNSALDIFRKEYLANDTSYSSYFTSITFLKTRDFTSLNDRLILLCKFVLSIFVGGTLAGTDSSLPAYTHRFFLHYYGGVLPIYIYFYLGWTGVCCIAVYVVYLLKKIGGKITGGVQKCMCVYVVATVPRWYLYSPLQLFRGVMLTFVVFKLSQLFLNQLKGRSKDFLYHNIRS